MTIHGTTDKPLLPANLAQFVLAILGLTNYPVASSNAVHEPSLGHGVPPAAVQTGSLTPEDFAKQYNLDPLYSAGFTGPARRSGSSRWPASSPRMPRSSGSTCCTSP